MSDQANDNTGAATAAEPVVMPFGKHKGKEIRSLPPTYLRWLLDPGLSLSLEVRAEVLKSIKERNIKTSGPVQRSVPWSQSEPAAEVEEPSRKDEKREQYNDVPRKQFRISNKGGFVKINGAIVRADEIRSIRPVRTPVQKEDCVLTHVMTVKLGCLGDGPQSPTKVWMTATECALIEEMLFKD